MKAKIAVVAIIAGLAVIAAVCVGYCSFGPRHGHGPTQAVTTEAVQTEGGGVAAGVSTQACAGLPPPPGWLAPKDDR